MYKSFLLGIIFFQFSVTAAEIQIYTVDASAAEISACIAEAKADQEYYQARLQGAYALLERAKGNVTFHESLVARARKLHPKGAMTTEQLEREESDLGDAKINVAIVQALVAERSAEVRAAEARTAQASEGRCIRLPSH